MWGNGWFLNHWSDLNLLCLSNLKKILNRVSLPSFKISIYWLISLQKMRLFLKFTIFQHHFIIDKGHKIGDKNGWKTIYLSVHPIRTEISQQMLTSPLLYTKIYEWTWGGIPRLHISRCCLPLCVMSPSIDCIKEKGIKRTRRVK